MRSLRALLIFCFVYSTMLRHERMSVCLLNHAKMKRQRSPDSSLYTTPKSKTGHYSWQQLCLASTIVIRNRRLATFLAYHVQTLRHGLHSTSSVYTTWHRHTCLNCAGRRATSKGAVNCAQRLAAISTSQDVDFQLTADGPSPALAQQHGSLYLLV